jgi:CBS domain-containing protein
MQQTHFSKEGAGMLAEQMLPSARERLATIDAGAPVKEAADLMTKPHTDLVVVCDHDGGMVGVLTKTDIVGQIRQCSGGGCIARVDTIMTRGVVSCRPNDVLQDIWSVMKERGLQRIPIIDQAGKPIGIIYARDALQQLLGESENEESLLRDYVMGIGYQ